MNKQLGLTEVEMHDKRNLLSLSEYHILVYEVNKTWWCDYIFIPWLQRLVSKFFVWKTKRIKRRFNKVIERMDNIKKYQNESN